MRVFVTGATGFVGTAVVRELLGAGHEVLGLARSDASAASLKAAGVEVHRGSLEDLDALREGAAASDGVIHTAFVHDFANFEASVATDLRAIQVLGETLAGSDRPFVVSSATGHASPGGPGGGPGTEDDRRDPATHAAPRLPAEMTALATAQQGVRASVIRLPSSVHGEGDHGFVPWLIDIARAKGVSAYPGDGTNRWAGVHRFDAAVLYRLALETAPAGSALHAVADEGVPVRQIAEVIGRRLDLPVVSVPREEAGDHFGWLGRFFTMDLAATSALTQKRFGWTPGWPGLIADIDQEYYFSRRS